MDNELVKKESSVPAAASNMMSEFSSEDFIIPRINLIQKMSKKNDGKTANYGQLRDNLNNKLLGSLEEPFEFIPIHGTKKWIVSEKDEKGKWKWKETVPYDGQRDFVADNGNVKNMLSYEFYVLDPREIAAGEDMPYVISFQSTSSKAGRKLVTQMAMRNARAGKPVYATAMELRVHEETTDDNTYGVMDVGVVREITDEEGSACEMWLKSIVSGAAKVKDDGVLD